MYKIVGISSCPSGIAHTYMAAKALTNEGKKYGLQVHFETQGQLGQENIVTQKEFDEADAIVLCCGIQPVGKERFEKYPDKTVKVDYSEVLKKPQIMIEALKKGGLIDQNIQKLK